MTASSFQRDEDHLHRLEDRQYNADRSLWASLLTVNGLILASAAFLASPSDYDQILLLLLIGTVSIAGLEVVANFRDLKVHAMGKTIDWRLNIGLGHKEKSVSRKVMHRYPDVTRLREIVALCLTGLEMVILGLMIVVE